MFVYKKCNGLLEYKNDKFILTVNPRTHRAILYKTTEGVLSSNKGVRKASCRVPKDYLYIGNKELIRKLKTLLSR